nr:MAG TPA: hypothetical protein [Bacteriophage sp.]
MGENRIPPKTPESLGRSGPSGVLKLAITGAYDGVPWIQREEGRKWRRETTSRRGSRRPPVP